MKGLLLERAIRQFFNAGGQVGPAKEMAVAVKQDTRIHKFFGSSLFVRCDGIQMTVTGILEDQNDGAGPNRLQI